MRKVILILTLFLTLTGLSVKADIIAPEHNLVTVRYLMDYPEYRKITPDNIESLSIIRYTEAGISERKVEDKDEIMQIYKFLRKIKILQETKWGCTDNTTMYSFVLKDGKKAVIEIECNWIVLRGRHYTFDWPFKSEPNNLLLNN
jgi:hypothetical protein